MEAKDLIDYRLKKNSDLEKMIKISSGNQDIFNQGKREKSEGVVTLLLDDFAPTQSTVVIDDELTGPPYHSWLGS